MNGRRRGTPTRRAASWAARPGLRSAIVMQSGAARLQTGITHLTSPQPTSPHLTYPQKAGSATANKRKQNEFCRPGQGRVGLGWASFRWSSSVFFSRPCPPLLLPSLLFPSEDGWLLAAGCFAVISCWVTFFETASGLGKDEWRTHSSALFAREGHEERSGLNPILTS